MFTPSGKPSAEIKIEIAFIMIKFEIHYVFVTFTLLREKSLVSLKNKIPSNFDEC